MNTTVYKYELKLTDEQSVNLPKGAEVLTIQVQHDTPCLWAMVDPNAPKEARFFETFGTGHVIRTDMGVERSYIGTYQIHDGALVFHVFERVN
jgi:hypothetical protein